LRDKFLQFRIGDRESGTRGGTKDKILQGFSNLLTCQLRHKHQTKVGNLQSDVDILLGELFKEVVLVLQCFLFFINELIEVLEQYDITVKPFADDVKLYMQVSNDTYNIKMQCALNALVESVNSWQLIISIEKRRVMYIGNVKFTSNLNRDGNTSSIVTSSRDFIVVMKHKLFPSTHIDMMVVEGSKLTRVLTLSTGRLFHATRVYKCAHILFMFDRCSSITP